MKTKTNPVIDKIAQFYASYSFTYTNLPRINQLVSHIRRKNVPSQQFVPIYSKDVTRLHKGHCRIPRHLTETWSMYANGKQMSKDDLLKVNEVLETSNKIVCGIGGRKNHYFMIEGPQSKILQISHYYGPITIMCFEYNFLYFSFPL